jgi:16S rRNA (adenine1518-N6/adenine1519-N6)-dimethyltransferase
VVEIGPGLGALTLPLLQALGQLDVVEIDRDLPQQLRAACADAGLDPAALQIYQADALNFAFASLRRNKQKLRLVGNLPYNISTPLIFHLLAQAEHIHDMYFMLQNEVVERLAAPAGGAHYGRLSVMVQYRCQVEALFQIGPDAFSPPPKVNSAMVRLQPWRQPPVTVADEDGFAQIVSRAFSQRRKTLRNSLRGLVSDSVITAAGIDPSARPETLSLAGFAALSHHANNSP